MEPDPTPGLRASDADREATVTRLHTAAQEGRLDHEELERRLDAAYSAQLCTDLDRLTVDVTPPPVAPAAPAPAPVMRRPRRTNGLAIASLLLGFFWIMWLGSAAAIVCGHVALRQIKESEGEEDGQALAISGLVLGYGGLAFFLFSLLFVFSV